MTAKWVTYLPANFGDPLCSTFESGHRQTDVVSCWEPASRLSDRMSDGDTRRKVRNIEVEKIKAIRILYKPDNSAEVYGVAP